MEQPYQDAKTPVAARITYCARCGAQNNAGAAFCQSCGAQFLATTAEPARAVKKPVPTVVNVIFAVLVLLTLGQIFTWIQGDKVTSPQNAAPSIAPAASPKSEAWLHLIVKESRWEKGGFGTIAMWRVTFKNNSDRPIGNIQYRTAYYSETGNLVDKGGVDSPLDKKIIQKVIPPKSTRTIEVNDGFTHSEAHRATFELVDCEFVTDSR